VINLGRTVLSKERKTAFQEEYIGHILIFCEGLTEKIYFDYFVSILEKSKFDDIQVVIETASGNASRVYKYAQRYLTEEENNRRYTNHQKYLVFDCDAPENVQNIIQQAGESCENFRMLLSNKMFEIWLLMHFENVEQALSKGELKNHLSKYLNREYKKANEGVVREIISNGDVSAAIANAERLCRTYKESGKNISQNINEMNPFTNVYELVEQLVGRVS
jgi:hypothetical protein